MQAPAGKQKRDPQSLAIDHGQGEAHEAPPARDHKTRASHRDGRWSPNAPRSRWGIRPLIMIGMLLAAFVLGWFGGFTSQWLLDLIVDETTRPAGAALDAVVERIINVE